MWLFCTHDLLSWALNWIDMSLFSDYVCGKFAAQHGRQKGEEIVWEERNSCSRTKEAQKNVCTSQEDWGITLTTVCAVQFLCMYIYKKAMPSYCKKRFQGCAGIMKGRKLCPSIKWLDHIGLASLFVCCKLYIWHQIGIMTSFLACIHQ